MKYLEASRLLRDASFSARRDLLLLSSGQTENLDTYLRAEFARAGIDCRIEHIAFNTLQQHLIADARAGDHCAAVLMPWDFLPALDWRGGIAADEPDPQACLRRIDEFAGRWRRRGGVACFVDAPTPPVFADGAAGARVLRALRDGAGALGAHFVDGAAFALESYLDSGVPLGGRHCGEIAAALVAPLLGDTAASRRVLVTDLDNVAWHGVIGEDGIDAISCAPAGRGYPHFLYQGYLKKLQRAGILVAAVSKNDPDLAALPFRRGEMPLALDDLVTIQASYHPKSIQIARLAESLGLPLDAFVFVDDNPVEIAEVEAALGAVATLQFPAAARDLPAFFDRLGEHFDLRRRSDEDRMRTALYRTRLAGLAPAGGDAAELHAFLAELAMRMRIRRRGADDAARALQLFNKTNQFNLNGRRIERAELERALADGARLYTAAVADRHGDHGEVVACLQGADGAIELLVMSCRVLQRRIEHRFLGWIAARLPAADDTLRLDYLPTARNTPVAQFLAALGIAPEAGRLAVPRAALQAADAAADDLFELSVE